MYCSKLLQFFLVSPPTIFRFISVKFSISYNPCCVQEFEMNGRNRRSPLQGIKVRRDEKVCDRSTRIRPLKSLNRHWAYITLHYIKAELHQSPLRTRAQRQCKQRFACSPIESWTKCKQINPSWPLLLNVMVCIRKHRRSTQVHPRLVSQPWHTQSQKDQHLSTFVDKAIHCEKPY